MEAQLFSVSRRKKARKRQQHKKRAVVALQFYKDKGKEPLKEIRMEK